MKKLLTYIVLVLLSPIAMVQAQEWAAEGTRWVYDVEYEDPSFWVKSHLTLQAVGDTLVQTPVDGTVQAKVILGHFVGIGVDGVLHQYDTPKVYTYADDNKVYILKKHNFATLYDFSANVGDTWPIPTYNNNTIPEECDAGIVQVYAKGDTLIQGQHRRYIKLHTLTQNSLEINGLVIEGIGNTTNPLLPRNACGICGHGPIGGLRCFSDANLDINMFPDEECEYLLYDNIQDVEAPGFKAYPNPATDMLTIDIPQSQSHRHHTIRVINMQGKTVWQQESDSHHHIIDVSALPMGVYMV